MNLAVLGATGRTGRHVVTQALARGWSVVALCRDASSLPQHPRLTTATFDLDNPSCLRPFASVDALVGTLGNVGGRKDILRTGARAVASAGLQRIVWLGGLGSADTRAKVGPLGPLLRLLLGEDAVDKTLADDLLRPLGASLVHAGPLGNGSEHDTARLVAAASFRPRFLPPGIGRADLARLLVDEASNPQFPGATSIALPH